MPTQTRLHSRWLLRNAEALNLDVMPTLLAGGIYGLAVVCWDTDKVRKINGFKFKKITHASLAIKSMGYPGRRTTLSESEIEKLRNDRHDRLSKIKGKQRAQASLLRSINRANSINGPRNSRKFRNQPKEYLEIAA